jgi:hypothetical protein
MKQTDILWNGNNTITAFPMLPVAVLSAARTAKLTCFVTGLNCYKVTVREEQNWQYFDVTFNVCANNNINKCNI